MTSDGPTKQEIEQVFHRLRAQTANKSCFDCNAKNPTWSSVTYGVFICIDCSAVHRNLGVHLTFVRSTNLDTNWTWVQLRQMQLGGNANASQFFRQHSCNTTDAQQKYNSRAAQLYRDKLHAAAVQAMKIHGTKLFLDTHLDKNETETKHEEDFFAECSNDNLEFSNNNNLNNNAEGDSPVVRLVDIVQKNDVKTSDDSLSTAQPSVDLLNLAAPIEAAKPTIGMRKIQPKRGLAAKKGGLGATRVKTNFADIEQRAQLADQQKEAPPERKLSPEEEAETVASVRLAYQDLSIKKTQEEEKLKAIDPVKAKQLERLGMGFNLKGGGVSHSVLTDMHTITQTNAPKHSLKALEKEPSTDFFEEYSTPMYTSPSFKADPELSQMGWETIEPIDMQSNITTMFSPSQEKKSSINEQPGRRMLSSGTTIKTYENDAAQKKFGNAKGISSDQYFGNQQSSIERAANLSRFQGSSSISSADYFGDGTQNTNSQRSFNNMQFNAPDLDDVKESVRQGVTKVAGRLSSLANDVMSSLHDKYGY